MTTVEMQTASLPSTFHAPGPYYEPTTGKPTTYADIRDAASRTSSKENRTPPAQGNDREGSSESPRTVISVSPVAQHGQLRGSTSPQSVAGKKRSANGDLKEPEANHAPEAGLTNTGRARAGSTLSSTSNASMLELSQQLRTRLTYAMVKVQNGWQTRSFEEVESLASASPRSTTFSHYSNNRHMLSPRAAMTAQMSRESSSSSDSSRKTAMGPPQYLPSAPTLMSPPASKGLAPSANIITRPPQERRRPRPNLLPPNNVKHPRPAPSQRTPSQTARIEADAVETLLFMASPNHSGSAKNSARFSPMITTPGTLPQKSPLRTTFPATTSPDQMDLSTPHTHLGHSNDKNAKLATVLERLDKDGDMELDRALNLMDQYYASKVAA